MTLKTVSTVGVIALCGPTCGGKTTLAQTLVARWPSVFAPVVTTTTRQPRPGEVQGIHYRFMSRFEFEQYATHGRLVERDEISGQMYGLQRDELHRLDDSGRIAVAVVTPNGIEPIRAACEALGKRLVSVYLGANREDLIVRFLQRYRADREDRAEHYSRRLMHLLDEQGAWANAAAYDVVEKQFGEATLDSVLERIQAQIAQGAVWVADDSGLRVTH
jgi:guanylate kinase